MNYRNKKILALAIGVYLAGVSQYTFAEENNKSGDVVISATRTEQEVKETPAAVQIITREEIETLGAQNLGDALRLATSIDVGSPAMAGRSVSLRGMSTRHVLILINGKRQVSEGSYSTANSYELNRIKMDNVERIEIVRGPSSSLYGSEGMAGVINIITRRPEKEEITVSIDPWRYSKSANIGGEDYFIRYDSGKRNNFGWIVSYDRDRISAFENSDREGGNHNSTNNQYGYKDYIDFEGVYDLSENNYLDFSASLQRDRLKARSNNLSFERYNNERNQFSLGLRGSNNKSNYQIRTYYGEHDKDGPIYNFEGGPMTDFDVSNRKSWTVEGNISTQYKDNHLFTAGAEYRSEDYWGTRVGDHSTTGVVVREGLSKDAGEFKMNSYAIYLQDEWLIGDKLLFIPSVRFDGSNKFSNNYSPKFGATYTLNDNYRLKVNAGKGFKAPTIDDMFMKMTRVMGPYQVTVNGNPNLEPEKSTSYEIGLEGEKGANFGKLTYFINDVSNLITTEMTPIIGPSGRPTGYIASYINEDKADIDGVEVEIGRYLNNNFTLKLNYTYLNATGTTGERLTDRAEHQGTVQLHYDNEEFGISTVFWNEWKKNYLSSVTSTNKTYTMWNVSFSKNWDDGLSGFFGIDNIFNKKDEDLNIYGAIFRAGVSFKI